MNLRLIVAVLPLVVGLNITQINMGRRISTPHHQNHAGGIFERDDQLNRVAFAFAVESLNDVDSDVRVPTLKFHPVINTLKHTNAISVYRQSLTHRNIAKS